MVKIIPAAKFVVLTLKSSLFNPQLRSVTATTTAAIIVTTVTATVTTKTTVVTATVTTKTTVATTTVATTTVATTTRYPQHSLRFGIYLSSKLCFEISIVEFIRAK